MAAATTAALDTATGVEATVTDAAMWDVDTQAATVADTQAERAVTSAAEHAALAVAA
jgi:hypothetical protein